VTIFWLFGLSSGTLSYTYAATCVCPENNSHLLGQIPHSDSCFRLSAPVDLRHDFIYTYICTYKKFKKKPNFFFSRLQK